MEEYTQSTEEKKSYDAEKPTSSGEGASTIASTSTYKKYDKPYVPGGGDKSPSAEGGSAYKKYVKPSYGQDGDDDRQSRYRNDSYDRKNEFSKDRDLNRSKFKKYDKISAKKLEIDYKKPEILKEFLTEKGKILSRLITGCSTQNQHKLTREVKRARHIGLLPNA